MKKKKILRGKIGLSQLNVDNHLPFKLTKLERNHLLDENSKFKFSFFIQFFIFLILN